MRNPGPDSATPRYLTYRNPKIINACCLLSCSNLLHNNKQLAHSHHRESKPSSLSVRLTMSALPGTVEKSQPALSYSSKAKCTPFQNLPIRNSVSNRHTEGVRQAHCQLNHGKEWKYACVYRQKGVGDDQLNSNTRKRGSELRL